MGRTEHGESMAKKSFDRAREDVGNVLALEHVNVTVPDQALATLFYVNTLGLTRDPYIDWGPFNVWVNAGRQQFHLPTANAQVLRGHTALVVPNLDSLKSRLRQFEKRFSGTCFGHVERKDAVEVTCPWGNRIRCFGPGRFEQMYLGIPYVEFSVPPGTAAGIGRFYTRVLGCPVRLTRSAVEVSMGQHQYIRFAETRKQLPEYDGHHLAIYVADFSGPHRQLKSGDLITEETDQHQYRFQKIVDPDNGELLYEVEHEVRSLFHPMWERHLVNRNPEQSFFNYRRDRDSFVPGSI